MLSLSISQCSGGLGQPGPPGTQFTELLKTSAVSVTWAPVWEGLGGGGGGAEKGHGCPGNPSQTQQRCAGDGTGRTVWVMHSQGETPPPPP